MDEPIHPLQALLNGMSADWKAGRAKTGMTLGSLIAALEALPAGAVAEGIGHADSYRGFYEDLAFDPDSKERTVENLLAECRSAMGKVFEGYKGGSYVMGDPTPLWIANWGACGPRLVGLQAEGGVIKPVTEEQD